MIRPSAVIFDMDGVIFDSERAVYNCWQEMAEKYGFRDLDIPYMKAIGVNAATCRQIFLDFYGPDFPYDAYNAERSQIFHARYDHGKLPLKPGVRELLAMLGSMHIPAAIASSTRTAIVTSEIRDAGLLEGFQAIVGGDMVKRSKPEPDIFLKAAEQLHVDAGKCMVIEDSYNGIIAADRAGMVPVMVPDMLPPDEEMRKRAAYILPSLSDVMELLDQKAD